MGGNTKKIIRDLEKERNALSQKEEFEKAKVLQNKIDAVRIIFGPYYRSRFDSDLNPNLNQDLRNKEMVSLTNILNKHGMGIKSLRRIECFDISNTSGTNATGSMVVFENGEKAGNYYRKFKIKTLKTPNDFAMIEEVLIRRLKHKEWPYPNLLVVDGGKGQVSAANKAIKQFNILEIPIIGLAKKEETIITSHLAEIKLPKDSSALKLVMRIRDEAHRFAITYHKKLRSKNLIT